MLTDIIKEQNHTECVLKIKLFEEINLLSTSMKKD